MNTKTNAQRPPQMKGEDEGQLANGKMLAKKKKRSQPSQGISEAHHGNPCIKGGKGSPGILKKSIG